MNLIRRDGKFDWVRFVRLFVVFGSFTLFGIAGCGNRMGCRGGGDGNGGVGAGDRDGDGVPNADDNCPDAFNPLVAYQVGDSLDECAVADGLIDADGMWQPDFDCDGVGDACDNAPLVFNPRVPYQPGDSLDDCALDEGLVVDGMWQPDFDCDGVGDVVDNCPDVPNPLVPYVEGESIDDCALTEGLVDADGMWQRDTDCDGVGDECDNCPLVPNPDQQDTNNNGVGDACCVVQADCEDGLFCTGGSSCDGGQCVFTGNPCSGATPVCVEANDECVACVTNNDCNDGIACTVDSCNTETGDCNNTPNNALCGAGQICSPVSGCVPDSCVGDACIPVDVDIAVSNREAFPCEVVEFTATTDPPGASISWSQIGGPSVSLTTLNSTVQVDLPPRLTAGQQILLRATATSPGRPNGTANATITILLYAGTQQVETKSGGAVQPGEQIEIRLADGEDDDWRVHWTQNPNDPLDARQGIPNPITTIGNNQTARFNAPQVVRTRNLRFNATGCMAKNIGVGLTGNLVVPVQRARIDDFDLPAQIQVGQQISVPERLMVSLIRTAQGVEPHEFDLDIDRGDPNNPDAGGFQLLIFVLDAQGNALPDNVEVDVDVDNATFTVTAAPDNTTVQVRVMVINIAGGPANPLAQQTKTTVVVSGG